ncbi:MAG: fibronectin type III domain-containing protein [Bdellovibrionales bacterium]|nr:fibronectin type III domain-containing protein [Bdellovibrionales bacterium]
MRKTSDLTSDIGLKFFRMLEISLILLITLGLESCDEYTKVSSALETPNLGGFLGVQSYSAKSDSSVTLHWIANSEASIYLIYRVENLIPIYQASVADKNSDHYTVTGLTPNSDYTFLVRMLSSNGSQDKNNTSVTFTTNSAPESPNSITLIDPSINPGFENRPTFQIGGVVSGQIVKLFTDSGCLNEVASGTATATTVDLRISSPLSGGIFSFYANSTNSSNSTSPCSSSSVNYTYNTNRIDFTTLGSYITMSLSASGTTVTW